METVIILTAHALKNGQKRKPDSLHNLSNIYHTNVSINHRYELMNEIHVLTHTSRFVGGEFIALVTSTKVAALGVSTLAISAAVSIFSTFINIYVKEMTSDKKLAVWPVSISRYYAKRLE